MSDEKPKCNSFVHKMIIQLNMFTTSMKHQINYHMKSTMVVVVEDWRRGKWNVKIFRINVIHVSSATILAMVRYSTSMLDQEMVFCFFAHQEMRFPLRNVQYPVVERLVVGQLVQSISEKAYRSSVVLEVRCKPMSIMPLMYLKIR